MNALAAGQLSRSRVIRRRVERQTHTLKSAADCASFENSGLTCKSYFALASSKRKLRFEGQKGLAKGPAMNGSTTPIITLFTAPKAFVGHIGLIQRNAIESWLRLRPTVDILLLGTDAGTAEIAAEFKLKHIPTIERNEFGTPLVSSLFKTVEGHSASKWLMLINADIMLTSEFLQFTARLDRVPKGLYIGFRSDLDVTETIDYSDPQWEQQLITRVKEEGRFRGAGDDSFNGTDYYIYPRDLYPSIPPFAIGRFFWDSWLVADVHRRKLPVVDVSAQIPAQRPSQASGTPAARGQRNIFRDRQSRRRPAERVLKDPADVFRAPVLRRTCRSRQASKPM